MDLKKLGVLFLPLTFQLVASDLFALECVSPLITPYFGNGMFNSQRAAERSRMELQKFMNKRGIIGPNQVVKLAYNFDEPVVEQLLQVATQKRDDVSRYFFSWLSNLSLAPDFFRELARTAAAAIDYKAYFEDADLQVQIKDYEAALASGKVLIVVAHSQGNFYSNKSYELLSRVEKHRNRMALVGVAAPVSYIADQGPYTTLTQDVIIDAVRLALPANTTNRSSSLSGHEFVEQYLRGNASGHKIEKDIAGVVSKLESRFSQPSLDALDYLDSSLHPFLRYTCQLQSTTRKFSDAECIALAALNQTYGWFGENRSVRSLKSLNEWIDRCDSKEFWHNKDRFDFFDCSVFSPEFSLDLQGNTNLELGFVSENHPECRWKNHEVKKRASSESISGARAILKSPPKEP